MEMRKFLAMIGVLFAVSEMLPAYAGPQAMGKKGRPQAPQEQRQLEGSAPGTIRPSGLVPSFPPDAACAVVASPFGSATRYDGSPRPESRYGGLHGGMDLSLREGTPLLAIAAGRIIAVGVGGQAEGNYLWLQHAPEDTGLPFWVYTKYQHLLSVPTRGVGETVQAGQVVGLSGKTGTTGGHYGATGYPHLHLTTFAGPNDRYERRGSRISAEGARIFDPVAVYIPNLSDLDEIERLPDDKKIVPIPYVHEDGSIRPPGSRVVWPVRCGKR